VKPVSELLAALNSRPASRVLLDPDGREVPGSQQQFPNRAAAAAEPVPPGYGVSIGVYMLDLVDEV
jgi:hypothetical protein